jgi:hypothetical protein
MKYIYCSQCNFKSPVIRKAMPKYATIIDVVEPHDCTKEAWPLDLTETPITQFVDRQKEQKSVQKLNDLSRPEGSTLFDHDLRDRRDEPKQVTTAPPGALGMLRSGEPSSPSHDMFDLDEDEERGIK